MKLKCQCCGFEVEFEDGEAAFQAGWDAPPHFIDIVACNLCPAVCIVLHKGHTKAHALWEREGRPATFSLDTCASDQEFGDSQAIARAQRGMDFLQGILNGPRAQQSSTQEDNRQPN